VSYEDREDRRNACTSKHTIVEQATPRSSLGRRKSSFGGSNTSFSHVPTINMMEANLVSSAGRGGMQAHESWRDVSTGMSTSHLHDFNGVAPDLVLLSNEDLTDDHAQFGLSVRSRARILRRPSLFGRLKELAVGTSAHSVDRSLSPTSSTPNENSNATYGATISTGALDSASSRNTSISQSLHPHQSASALLGARRSSPNVDRLRWSSSRSSFHRTESTESFDRTRGISVKKRSASRASLAEEQIPMRDLADEPLAALDTGRARFGERLQRNTSPKDSIWEEI
jgi:hypothetical protein